MAVWQVQQAKTRLNELIEDAHSKCPHRSIHVQHFV